MAFHWCKAQPSHWSNLRWLQGHVKWPSAENSLCTTDISPWGRTEYHHYVHVIENFTPYLAWMWPWNHDLGLEVCWRAKISCWSHCWFCRVHSLTVGLVEFGLAVFVLAVCSWSWCSNCAVVYSSFVLTFCCQVNFHETCAPLETCWL